MIEFNRTTADINGNSRFVCHFLDLEKQPPDRTKTLEERYALAIKFANRFGGRKYHNKKFGGCIVFQTTMPEELSKTILKTLEQ